MAAAGDDAALAGPRRDPHEHGLEPEGSDLQPDFVILGHAAAGERPAVLHGGELGERPPGDRTADAGERNRRADGFAHDQFLDVRLGELVAIMAADPARIGIGQRQHRQLDHRCAFDQAIEDLELERVDHVLGVVEHHRLGRAAGRSLIGDQRVVQMVEAVGLGRRPVRLDLDASIRGSSMLAIAAAVAGSLR